MKINSDKKTATREQEIDRLINKELDRRSFLRGTAGVVSGFGLISTIPLLGMTPKSQEYPFTLGVASGDPLPDGVVLWTRLAPRPLMGGGMPANPVDVQWEVSEDQSFHRIVKEGKTVAAPEYGHSVHVEVDGLQPDRWYHYRFKMGEEASPTGRTKTAPSFDKDLKELNFAFASCQKYTHGYYTAYEHMVNENLDVVFFLGDYIYEKNEQGQIERRHLPDREIYSLEDYRIRYGQYKSDPLLQAAHAAFPWIVAPDDHEVKNNWGGEGPPYENNEQFLARRAAAFQAYYEHMPLRKAPAPHNMQLYRGFSYGNLVEFSILDTRQFRTNFACGAQNFAEQCDERLDPSRTILGDEQEAWLLGNLKRSSAHWNILPQQIRMAQVDRKSGAGTAYSMDKWDGYVGSRNRLFEVVKNRDVSNFVVLTGDSHKNWVNDLKEDFDNPNSPVLGTEFMGTSICSSGNGFEIDPFGEKVLKENPHIRYYNAERGYVRCKVTPKEMRADFRVIPYVTKPGAPVETRATFVIKNGQPGACRV